MSQSILWIDWLIGKTVNPRHTPAPSLDALANGGAGVYRIRLLAGMSMGRRCTEEEIFPCRGSTGGGVANRRLPVSMLLQRRYQNRHKDCVS